MTPKINKTSDVLTLNINDLRKIVPAAEIQWLEQKKRDEELLKTEREDIQLKLNKTLHRLIKLDDQLEVDRISDQEYRSLDSLRKRLNLRHQQLAERLVRVGTRLARAKSDLGKLETAIYEDLTNRGLI
ncbi:uncharacterized protein LOC6544656 [Drosophila erecta]|uniref:Uncharacterized protein n=1 Tax=Drosophila erecta TaxID=7220 RepID=B3NH54_DROER|nr:uncharacterized protein LOC6544656 [Drosophila erecta]EDV51511.1 uncharacterized protein Dere_GG15553 [Drosophila erecta]